MLSIVVVQTEVEKHQYQYCIRELLISKVPKNVSIASVYKKLSIKTIHANICKCVCVYKKCLLNKAS